MVKKRPKTFPSAHLVKVHFELEPVSFGAEEVTTCFRGTAESQCQNHPHFRLISLDGAGQTPDGDVEASVGVSLLCRSCATIVARETLDEIDGEVKSNVPTLGIVLLPLHVEPTLAERLRVNVTPELSID